MRLQCVQRISFESTDDFSDFFRLCMRTGWCGPEGSKFLNQLSTAIESGLASDGIIEDLAKHLVRKNAPNRTLDSTLATAAVSAFERSCGSAEPEPV